MLTLRKAGSAVWLAYLEDALTLFTPDFIQNILSHISNGVLVLNIDPLYIKEVTARIKKVRPGLKIVQYVKFQRINGVSGASGFTTGNTYFDRIAANADAWCIKRVSDGSPKFINGYYWPDITNTEFRADWVAFTAAEVVANGTDGVFIDSHHWYLAGGVQSIVNWTTLNANWQTASEAVLSELKAAGVAVVMFNGMWCQEGEQQVLKQGEIYTSAGSDGSLAEFSYLDGVGNTPEGSLYSTFVDNLNEGFDTIGSGKFLIVNSQRDSGVYGDYMEDYNAALYAYACYLLGPGASRSPAMTGWHFGNFQCAPLVKERSGGYDYMDFQDLRLGRPTSDATDLSAPFTPTAPQGVIDNGFYLLTPAGLTAAGITLPASLWDFQEVSGSIIDQIGAIDLTTSGTPGPTYRYGSRAFSSRYGLFFDGVTTSQRASMLGTEGPNPTTTSSVWLAIVSLFPPSNVAGVIAGGNNLQVRMSVDGNFKATCGANSTDSSGAYIGSEDAEDPTLNLPYPAIVAVKHDLTDTDIHVYTHLGEDITATRVAVSNSLKGFGAVIQTVPMLGGVFQAMMWSGATAEGLDVADVISKLVVPITGKYRTYEGGIVLVAPQGGTDQTFTLTRRYYTRTGVPVGPGSRLVAAGTAEILLLTPPTTPPSSLPSFGLKAVSAWRGTFAVSPSKTEFMMQTTKSGLYRWPTLNFRVRSSSAGSCILVRCEVDDGPKTHAILVVRPTGGTFTKTTHDYPYSMDATGSATNEYASTTFSADGNWHDVSINLDTELGFTVHRVVSVRVVGAAELSSLYLSGRVAR